MWQFDEPKATEPERLVSPVFAMTAPNTPGAGDKPNKPPTCAHPVLAFGCESCILKEREASIAEAAKVTLCPLCPECGLPTILYEKDAKTMTLDYSCTAGWTQDGEPLCEGEVLVKIR